MDLLLLGVGLGIAAGVSPGPLLAVVISSSLERGFGAGLRVAIAPLLTDGLIIFLTIVALDQLSADMLRGLAILGGLLLLYLGVQIIRDASRTNLDLAREDRAGAGDLLRGAAANFFNPQPWISWATVGGPLVIGTWAKSPLRAVLFVTGFYVSIVGSKIAIAALVARSRSFLGSRGYQRTLTASGLLLIVMAVLLVWKAWGS